MLEDEYGPARWGRERMEREKEKRLTGQVKPQAINPKPETSSTCVAR